MPPLPLILLLMMLFLLLSGSKRVSVIARGEGEQHKHKVHVIIATAGQGIVMQSVCGGTARFHLNVNLACQLPSPPLPPSPLSNSFAIHRALRHYTCHPHTELFNTARPLSCHALVSLPPPPPSTPPIGLTLLFEPWFTTNKLITPLPIRPAPPWA